MPRPKPEIYRWPSRAPWYTVQWHRAIWRPKILSIREKMGVSVEIGARRWIRPRVFDLLLDGIGIDHYSDRTCEMLVA